MAREGLLGGSVEFSKDAYKPHKPHHNPGYPLMNSLPSHLDNEPLASPDLDLWPYPKYLCRYRIRGVGFRVGG